MNDCESCKRQGRYNFNCPKCLVKYIYSLPKQLQEPWRKRINKDIDINEEAKTDMNRTIQQNKSMHKFFTMVAEKCNEIGVDQKAVFEARNAEIPVTEHTIKAIWQSVQDQMFGKSSTTELETSEVSRVHEIVMKALGEKLGVPYVEFPSDERRR